MVAPVVEHHRGAVLGHGEEGVVGVGRDDPGGDGLLGCLAGGGLVGIDHAHRHPELQGVGEAEPFGEVSEVDIIVLAEGFGAEAEVLRKDGADLVELNKHPAVDLLLGVIGNGEGLSLGVGEYF